MMMEFIQMREENEKKRIRTLYLWKKVRTYVFARMFIAGANNNALKRQLSKQGGI